MMSLPFDFTRPWVLLLLPLALLPLIRRRGDALAFSAIALLPADRTGSVVAVLARAVAMLAIAALVSGLAGPGRSHQTVAQQGSGAAVLLLMDRSASMDEPMNRIGLRGGGDVKNTVARASLIRFVDERPSDRFAFMMFGISPILAVPFTDNHRVIDAAIAATRIGRGMPDTQLDRGLLAAISQFDLLPAAEHRAIVLVSDGGAQLNDDARRRIAEGLVRNHVALYFVYLRSGPFSPDLTKLAPGDEGSAEADLQRFFLSLATPYRLYQAGDADAMAAAMAEINRQQQFPLTWLERLPRQDRSGYGYAVALACCAALLALRIAQVRSWP